MTGTESWTRAERTSRWREMVDILDRLLRHRETTYEGRYYRVDAAVMAPPPVQRPRPRLVLPAHGPVGLRLVAEYAETWNTMTAADFADVEAMTIPERVAAVREQSAILDDFCEQIGRDPRGIRRSVMAQEPMSNAFRSVGFFEDYVGAFSQAGIEDFVFFWPTPYRRAGDVDAAIAREERVMEQVAASVLPRSRALAGPA